MNRFLLPFILVSFLFAGCGREYSIEREYFYARRQMILNSDRFISGQFRQEEAQAIRERLEKISEKTYSKDMKRAVKYDLMYLALLTNDYDAFKAVISDMNAKERKIAYLMTIRFFSGHKRPKEGLAILKKMKDDFPSDRGLDFLMPYYKAFITYGSEDFDRYFEKAVSYYSAKAAPDNDLNIKVGAYNMLYLLYLMSNDKQKALAQLDNILALDLPEKAYAVYAAKKVQLLVILGRKDEARALYDKLKARFSPETPAQNGK